VFACCVFVFVSLDLRSFQTVSSHCLVSRLWGLGLGGIIVDWSTHNSFRLVGQ
jgi:hypothetical protein